MLETGCSLLSPEPCSPRISQPGFRREDNTENGGNTWLGPANPVDEDDPDELRGDKRGRCSNCGQLQRRNPGCEMRGEHGSGESSEQPVSSIHPTNLVAVPHRRD